MKYFTGEWHARGQGLSSRESGRTESYPLFVCRCGQKQIVLFAYSENIFLMKIIMGGHWFIQMY